MGGILIYVVVFAFSLFWYISTRRSKKLELGKGVKLPPGSVGWPYIGETPQLYSQDPTVFFADKQKRFELNLINLIN